MKNKMVSWLSAITRTSYEITPDIFALNFRVVSAYMIGKPDSDSWVLIDTGLENSANYIIKQAEQRFGKNNPPQAIILTHGHFDHVGAVFKLIKKWDVPVYIHELELPHITGESNYPPPDDTVDEGLVAQMSPTFPHHAIDLEGYAKPLPIDGTVPGMPEWQWIHTPGHSPGHISLFRVRDQAIIVGDAFATLKQESLLSVITQNKEISGPPKYLTTDWEAAKESIIKIYNLQPNIAITSHGRPLKGASLTSHLELLITKFDTIAKPGQGKYVNNNDRED